MKFEVRFLLLVVVMGSIVHADTLAERLVSSDPTVQQQAFTELNGTDATAKSYLVGPLEQTLESGRINTPSMQAAGLAGSALQIIGREPSVQPMLIPKMMDDLVVLEPPSGRWGANEYARGVLVSIGVPAHLALTQGLMSSDEKLRYESAVTIGESGESANDLTPNLINVLKDQSERVEDAAAEALKKMSAESREEAVHSLLESIADSNSEIRKRIIHVLGIIGPSAEALPSLIQALKDSSEIVRCEAATAIGAMGQAGAPAIDALKELADKEHIVHYPNEKFIPGFYAEGALDHIGTPEALKAASDFRNSLGPEWQAHQKQIHDEGMRDLKNSIEQNNAVSDRSYWLIAISAFCALVFAVCLVVWLFK